MALFTDSTISEAKDLKNYESDILELAGTEGIELSNKLKLASDEIGLELEEFLRQRAGGGETYSSNSGLRLEQVVVTPALKQWHILRALELIYHDVQDSQIASRFEGKSKDYQRRARWAADTLFRIGVGIVDLPIPRAAIPDVRSLQGSTGGATYQVSVAWRNDRGESGAASPAAIVTVVSSGVIGVRAKAAPEGVSGFDIYAGRDASSMAKQTSTPLAPGDEWVMPDAPLVEGAPPPAGQEPDWWLRNDRVLLRG